MESHQSQYETESRRRGPRQAFCWEGLGVILPHCLFFSTPLYTAKQTPLPYCLDQIVRHRRLGLGKRHGRDLAKVSRRPHRYPSPTAVSFTTDPRGSEQQRPGGLVLGICHPSWLILTAHGERGGGSRVWWWPGAACASYGQNRAYCCGSGQGLAPASDFTVGTVKLQHSAQQTSCNPNLLLLLLVALLPCRDTHTTRPELSVSPPRFLTSSPTPPSSSRLGRSTCAPRSRSRRRRHPPPQN